MNTFFAILGAIVSVYFSVRVIATVVDVLQRWRSGVQARKETPTVAQLSFWSELVRATEGCRETGEFPFGDYALTIDWEKVSAEDRERLVGIKNPVKAIERQLNFLFASHSVADKMEVIREKNCLHICSTS
jgi:hypothetical protein